MPLVRISIPQGKPPEFRRAVSAGVHQAMAVSFCASKAGASLQPVLVQGTRTP